MCEKCVKRAELHLHTDVSNLIIPDCINKIDAAILNAYSKGVTSMAITDHESVSNHMKGLEILKQLKKEGKVSKDFKLILGNEIYLVNTLEEVRDKYKSGKTKFPHYLLLAKNKEGHKALRLLSTHAWRNSFTTGGMLRRPTTKQYLEEIINKYPNTLIATTACAGSESSIHILNMDQAKKDNNQEAFNYHYNKLIEFIEWNIDLHGEENFFLELQPSGDYEQRTINLALVQLSKKYNLDLIITNDVHYLDKEDREIHSAYLKSKGEERETDAFYSHCYLHHTEEIYKKLDYLDGGIVSNALMNTLKVADMVEEYSLSGDIKIPRYKTPEFEVKHIFKDYYNECKYIDKIANSDNTQDQFLMYRIEQGFEDYIIPQSLSKEKYLEHLKRIDIELKQLWDISQRELQPMSAYYVTVAHVVDLIWGDECGDKSRYVGSLLGSGRGSSVSFLICYLLGITQVNPLNYGVEVPYWRHLTSNRNIADLDIDLDINSTKKQYVFERLKESFGKDKVVQVCTFKTEKSKSAIRTACRGLGIGTETSGYLASLIPVSRGEVWSLRDCFEGNDEKGREKQTELIKEISKHPKLKETSLAIEGLISGRSIHAGGVLISDIDEDIVDRNAIMVAPNGTEISQFDLSYSQMAGQIKFDLLVTEATDKVETALGLLLDTNAIEWQGTLRKTFNKYLHPEVIDKINPNMYNMVANAKIPDLFQFSTQLAQSAIHKAKPKNLIELLSINSLIRLMVEDGEQPIDTFIRFKHDISQWYDEMRDFGLDENEIKVFEKHLLHLNGVADTQESIMLMGMDQKIGASDLALMDQLRKGVAKKIPEKTKAAMEQVYINAEKAGNRKVVIDYMWKQVSRMLTYSFNIPHTLAYSLISLEQIYINYMYDPLYWNTAVLTVNSGSQEVGDETKSKTTNYGKIATAMGDLKKHGTDIALPSINKSRFYFFPDIENRKILFSLKGLVGINDDISDVIIQNRPYTSFKDFHERIYKTKLIQTSHMIKLIKAGCFDEFDNRVNIMRHFLVSEVDKKEKLTMGNLKRCVEYDCIDHEQFKHQLEMYNFDQYYKKLKKKTVTKPKDTLYYLPKIDTDFYFKHYSEDTIVDSEGDFYIVSHKLYDKEYKAHMAVLKEWLTTSEAARQYNIAQFNELWNKHADGSVAKWEMQSVSYYATNHELEDVDRNMYGVSNFFELSPEPIVTSTRKTKNRTYENYEVFTLMGTVLDKNKDKHSFTLLTPEGVVTCKTYSGAFSNYDRTISRQLSNGKKETLEKSWFTRGNLLMVRGFRRDDQFVLRTYGSRDEKQSTISMITNVYEDGTLGIKSKRDKA